MARWFNIAGPCFPDEHYMIPPERRFQACLELIETRTQLIEHEKGGRTQGYIGASPRRRARGRGRGAADGTRYRSGDR